jgi:hypothetical protein
MAPEVCKFNVSSQYTRWAKCFVDMRLFQYLQLQVPCLLLALFKAQSFEHRQSIQPDSLDPFVKVPAVDTVPQSADGNT